MRKMPAAARSQHVTTAVGEVAVRRTPTHGAGPHAPAILVHGLEGSALNWVDLSDALADRLDSVAVDLPGFGMSPPPDDKDYSIAGHARAVAAVADAVFPGEPLHVFGNSMGGAVAVELAARRPELVRTLCLVSPALPSLRANATNIPIPVMAIPRVGDFMFDRASRADVERRVGVGLDVCFADPSRMPPQRRAELEAEFRHRDDMPWVREAFVASVQGLLSRLVDRGPDRLWALAGHITAPTLVVYGTKDRLIDSRAAYRVTNAFRNVHVMTLRDAGHLAQVEHPRLVARAWRDVLGSTRP